MSADDEQAIERIRYKASMHFVHELEAYMKYAGEHFFLVADIQLKDVCISASEIRDCYLGTMITPIRRDWKTASILSGRVRTEDGETDCGRSQKVKTSIKNMFKFQNVLSMYKEFFSYRNKPDMFVMNGRKTIEYADVFPRCISKCIWKETRHTIW